ncbi:MAG: pyridoxal phosphate-dependent aminotransferase [Acidobacteria bacterium]|nr:pyridoxal phosphate-dependent aminotransferase [Acidobacteriota bacterium]
MYASVAPSAARIEYSRIREIANLAMEMDRRATCPEERVLRLYFGESNAPTPEFIRQAAIRAMADGFTYYTSNAGLPSLREALAEYYAGLHSVRLDPSSEIVVTSSGVQAIHTAIRATLDPGDEALILTPIWPNAITSVEMANARAVVMAQPLRGSRYAIDFDAMEAAVTPRTRLLIATSPSNPLGWVATEEDQQRLLEFTRRHGLWLMADEVYDRLYYRGEGAAPSILRLATREDAVIVVQSFSKSWCMTGWRLGWLIARKDLAAKVTEFNEPTISCATAFVQKAGETALREGEPHIARLLTALRSRRDLCRQALEQMPGVTVPEPDGAFYLFPKIAGLGDSFDFCRRLLAATRLGVAPGAAFAEGGEGSVRICYAGDSATLEDAMRRLGSFLAA